MSARELIIKYEGFLLKPYKDTKGILTIGYGYNLTEGITKEIAEYLLKYKMDIAITDCEVLFHNFNLLHPSKQDILINMAYNMGRTRLSTFRKMIKAIAAYNFDEAAAEMLDSKWYNDVGTRALELASMMKKRD